MRLRYLLIALLLTGCVRPLPGPQPAPLPPAPIVVPITPAPLAVVIVKDNSKLSDLPSEQLAALMSGTLRDYCKSHCRLGPDGKTPEFRTYEWDTDTKLESKDIQDLFSDAVSHGKASGAPWLAVSNGKAGFSGPFPATETEALAVLKKYGGE